MNKISWDKFTIDLERIHQIETNRLEPNLTWKKLTTNTLNAISIAELSRIHDAFVDNWHVQEGHQLKLVIQKVISIGIYFDLILHKAFISNDP